MGRAIAEANQDQCEPSIRPSKRGSSLFSNRKLQVRRQNNFIPKKQVSFISNRKLQVRRQNNFTEKPGLVYINIRYMYGAKLNETWFFGMKLFWRRTWSFLFENKLLAWMVLCLAQIDLDSLLQLRCLPVMVLSYTVEAYTLYLHAGHCHRTHAAISIRI